MFGRIGKLSKGLITLGEFQFLVCNKGRIKPFSNWLKTVNLKKPYSMPANEDITDCLSDEQLKELEMLANEPDEKDTQSLEEFNKATEKWRTK